MLFRLPNNLLLIKTTLDGFDGREGELFNNSLLDYTGSYDLSCTIDGKDA